MCLRQVPEAGIAFLALFPFHPVRAFEPVTPDILALLCIMRTPSMPLVAGALRAHVTGDSRKEATRTRFLGIAAITSQLQ
jgi:hypothetical protein